MVNREELIEEAERGNREREARDHRALFAAAERNRLIEEAATAILNAADVHPDDPDGDHGYYAQTWKYAVQDAEAALAVFEQAHTAHAKPVDTSPERAKIGADFSHVTPADGERDGVAKAMCAIEARSKAASLEEVQTGVQRWMRHRYEAERLIEELMDVGFEVRRTVQGEPANAPHPEKSDIPGGAMSLSVQGEPTDAQVLAALNAMTGRNPGEHLRDYADSSVSNMRAALRAAAATQTGEQA